MIIADTSGLLALVVKQEKMHDRIVDHLHSTSTPLIVGPLVLAEFDYLLRQRVNVDDARRVIRSLLNSRSIDIASLSFHDIQTALDIDQKYAALDLGLADASVVVLADRYATADILTLDERHFRAIVQICGQPFRLYPADLA